jgi:serine/threonine protein kinase
MDYCAVGSVVTLLERSGMPFSEPQIAFILHSTLSALVYLHGQKIIHRYIHPALGRRGYDFSFTHNRLLALAIAM